MPKCGQWCCPQCGVVVKATGALALRTCKARHVREVHSAEGPAVVAKRRAQQRERQSARRRAASVGGPDCGAKAWLISITCPPRRSRLWDRARDVLLQAGFLATSVRRRVGLDMCEGATRCPKGLAPSTFLLWDFHRRWLPWAIQTLRRSPRLRVIAWAEDDLELQPRVTAATLVQSWDRCPKNVAWLGYIRKGGKPWWGSHLIAMNLDGAVSLKRRLDEEAAAVYGTRRPMAYLCGLDTWCRRALDCDPKKRLIWAPPKTLARQRRHTFRGRR